MGTHFVRFLAACYLAFNMDYRTVTLALASLPPAMPPRRQSGWHTSPTLWPPSECLLMVTHHACPA